MKPVQITEEEAQLILVALCDLSPEKYIGPKPRKGVTEWKEKYLEKESQINQVAEKFRRLNWEFFYDARAGK